MPVEKRRLIKKKKVISDDESYIEEDSEDKGQDIDRNRHFAWFFYAFYCFVVYDC